MQKPKTSIAQNRSKLLNECNELIRKFNFAYNLGIALARSNYSTKHIAGLHSLLLQYKEEIA